MCDTLLPTVSEAKDNPNSAPKMALLKGVSCLLTCTQYFLHTFRHVVDSLSPTHGGYNAFIGVKWLT